jgi:hypothetical protein
MSYSLAFIYHFFLNVIWYTFIIIPSEYVVGKVERGGFCKDNICPKQCNMATNLKQGETKWHKYNRFILNRFQAYRSFILYVCLNRNSQYMDYV